MPPTPPANERYAEIDILRTLAILGMVLYHGAYDLHAIYGWSIDVFSGGWIVLQRMTAWLFLLLSGVSFAIAHERAKSKGNPWKRHLRRALTILAAALLVTAVTWTRDPQTYVRFGILHLIGTGILLLPFFARLKEWTIVAGAAAIAAGLWLGDLREPSGLLLPLGVMYQGFRTIDYFPLLPWFGVMLIGHGIGHFFYVRRKPRSRISLPGWMTWPGRHSLGVYLWHQPILFFLLYVAAKM